MWTVLIIISILAAGAVAVFRIATIGRRTPHPDDRDRQHEVPGAHHDGPPPPGFETPPRP